MNREVFEFIFVFVIQMYIAHWCYNKLFLGENAVYKRVDIPIEKKKILFNQEERKEIIKDTDKGRELNSRFRIVRSIKSFSRKFLNPILNKINKLLVFLYLDRVLDKIGRLFKLLGI